MKRNDISHIKIVVPYLSERDCPSDRYLVLLNKYSIDGFALVVGGHTD